MREYTSIAWRVNAKLLMGYSKNFINCIYKGINFFKGEGGGGIVYEYIFSEST